MERGRYYKERTSGECWDRTNTLSTVWFGTTLASTHGLFKEAEGDFWSSTPNAVRWSSNALNMRR
jgi:hypothetical protein